MIVEDILLFNLLFFNLFWCFGIVLGILIMVVIFVIMFEMYICFRLFLFVDLGGSIDVDIILYLLGCIDCGFFVILLFGLSDSE